MPAFCKNVDLCKEAFEALSLVNLVFDPHDLDGDLLTTGHVDG